MRHRRPLSAATLGVGLLAAMTVPALAGTPTWGPVAVISSDSASRQSLARTATDSAEYIHSVTSTLDGSLTHHLNGAWYRRTSSDGAAWAAVKRLNPEDHLVGGAGVATAGRYVFTTWVRPAVTGNARMLYIRRNTNHGDLDAWSTRIRLTPATARIDAPSIAASGASVFVAYTNTRTGRVRLQSSHDRGRTWTGRSVGRTSAPDEELGQAGHPIVVATGHTVAVFWVSNANGSVRGRISIDVGAHWGSVTTLGNAGDGGIPSATARGGRIAVAASDGSTPGWYRVWTNGTWGPSTLIPPLDVDPEPPLGYGGTPTVALRGETFLGVAYTVFYAGLDGHSTLTWHESPDGGLSWLPDESVSVPTPIIFNRNASIVWRADSLHIQWNENNEGDPSVRIRSRR